MNHETIEKLALIVAEKHSPSSSLELTTKQVLEAYEFAKEYINENKKPSEPKVRTLG